MTLRRTSHNTLALLLSTFVLIPLACSQDDPPKKKVAIASGGSTETPTGGTSPTNGGNATTGGTATGTTNGGAGTTVSSSGGPSSGGSSTASSTDSTNGGSTEGGATAAGGTTEGGGAVNGGTGADGGTTTTTSSAGASAGTTSTTPITTCTSDITCKPEKLCNTTLKRCVQCLSGSDCTASPVGKFCSAAGSCVACLASTDCPDPTTSACVNNTCVAITACNNSLDCKDPKVPVCSTTEPKYCVECNTKADCTALGKTGQTCVANQCTKPCASNAECVTAGTGKFCSKDGICGDKLCAAGTEQNCVSNGIATCNATGDGWGTPTACPTDQVCSASGNTVSCITPVCPTTPLAQIDPCKGIPKFIGTQTVDAKNDDLCNIPAFTLSFTKNAGVFHKKDGTYPHVATAQVAWSDKFLHFYAEVTGAPPRIFTGDTGKIWDGDSIELMITTSNTVTGHTVDDANAIHVQMNYEQAAIVKSDATSGNATKITDATQFLGKKNADGYIVELKLPWPNSPTLATGTQVRFDLAMNVDMQSVDPQYQGRDAQVVYVMTAVTGTSACSEAQATPFCDDRLWCPTSLQ